MTNNRHLAQFSVKEKTKRKKKTLVFEDKCPSTVDMWKRYTMASQEGN
jgi:hypothetical protein